MRVPAATIAVFLALSFAASSPAQDAGPTPAGEGEREAAGPDDTKRDSLAATAGSAGAANVMLGMRARELIGRDVVNAAGRNVGQIGDIVLDEGGEALYAVIGVGGFLGIGRKNVAIPFEQLRLGADNVILMSQQNAGDLRELPTYKEGQWKSLDPNETLGGR